MEGKRFKQEMYLDELATIRKSTELAQKLAGQWATKFKERREEGQPPSLQGAYTGSATAASSPGGFFAAIKSAQQHGADTPGADLAPLKSSPLSQPQRSTIARDAGAGVGLGSLAPAYPVVGVEVAAGTTMNTTTESSAEGGIMAITPEYLVPEWSDWSWCEDGPSMVQVAEELTSESPPPSPPSLPVDGNRSHSRRESKPEILATAQQAMGQAASIRLSRLQELTRMDRDSRLEEVRNFKLKQEELKRQQVSLI